MGDMADYYLEQDMMRSGVIEQPKSRKTNKRITWINSDGHELEPRDMSSSHLLNCVHLCEKREGHKGETFLNNAPTYRAMVHELIKRDRLSNEYLQLSLNERLKVAF